MRDAFASDAVGAGPLESVRQRLHDVPTRVLQCLLFSFAGFLAVAAIVLRIGVAAHSEFLIVAIPIVILAVVFAGYFLATLVACLRHSADRRGDLSFLATAVVLGMLGLCLALAINRPDDDDSIYVPKAVFYTEQPHAPLDDRVQWVASANTPLSMAVFPYYELTQAAFSAVFATNYLDVYHLSFPALAGFLIVISTLLLTKTIAPDRYAACVGTLFVIVFAVLLGETHRTYGNLSFARVFQGKFMFLTVGMTSWSYFSLRYFLEREFLSWLALLALGVGMACATPSAMVLLPLLSVILVLAFEFARRDPQAFARTWSTYSTYFLALLPLVVMALEFRGYAVKNLGVGSVVNNGFPKDFASQLELLVDPHYPLMPVTFLVSSIAVLALSRLRMFFLAWLVIPFMLLLNPLVAPLVIRYLTTENLYWRLFYLLPFPLTIAVAGSLIWRRSSWAKLVAMLLLVALVPFALRGPTTVIRHVGNGATYGYPRYKIRQDEITRAEHIIRAIAPASIFAPLEVSTPMLMLSSKYPQVHTRKDFLRLTFGPLGRGDEAERREASYQCLYGDCADPGERTALAALLNSPDRPHYVVVLSKKDSDRRVIELLGEAGYGNPLIIDQEYEVVSDMGRARP